MHTGKQRNALCLLLLHYTPLLVACRLVTNVDELILALLGAYTSPNGFLIAICNTTIAIDCHFGVGCFVSINTGLRLSAECNSHFMKFNSSTIFSSLQSMSLIRLLLVLRIPLRSFHQRSMFISVCDLVRRHLINAILITE